MRRRGTLAWLIAVAMLGITGVSRAQTGDAAARLKTLVEDVAGADAVRYDARDDRGVGLDGLDVLAVAGGGYVGVHHAPVAGRFELRVATSGDLLHWAHRATLDTDAAQGSLAALPGGGFVVAYEHGSTMRVLPRTELPPEITGSTDLWTLNKNQLRFRFYPDIGALLAGRSARRYTAPRRLSRTDEGTPDLRIRTGSVPADLVLDVSFHHFADQDGDGLPDADRQATGTLRAFRRWSAAPAPEIDSLLLGAPLLHDGFAAPPAGNIGDRDQVEFEGHRFVVHEAQYVAHDFGSWRLFLRDAAGGSVIPLTPRTAGGTRAFGNANVIALPGPTGRPGLLVTAFAFSEGAAPGEAGALIAFHDLEG